jgi:hypothetical protein
MSRNYYKAGTYNAICEICGSKFKNDELLKRWDNKMVCRDDYEVRHPLDFLRTSQRDLSVPWTRPEASDQFIASFYIDTALAGQAIAGRAVSGIG